MLGRISEDPVLQNLPLVFKEKKPVHKARVLQKAEAWK